MFFIKSSNFGIMSQRTITTIYSFFDVFIQYYIQMVFRDHLQRNSYKVNVSVVVVYEYKLEHMFKKHI